MITICNINNWAFPILQNTNSHTTFRQKKMRFRIKQVKKIVSQKQKYAERVQRNIPLKLNVSKSWGKPDTYSILDKVLECDRLWRLRILSSISWAKLYFNQNQPIQFLSLHMRNSTDTSIDSTFLISLDKSDFLKEVVEEKVFISTKRDKLTE